MVLFFALIAFLVADIVVTLIGIGHTIFNWKVLKMENAKEKVTAM